MLFRSLSLFIFCLLDLSYSENGVLKYFIISVTLSLLACLIVSPHCFGRGIEIFITQCDKFIMLMENLTGP